MDAAERDKKAPCAVLKMLSQWGVTLEQVAAQEMKNVKQMEDAGFKGLAIAYRATWVSIKHLTSTS